MTISRPIQTCLFAAALLLHGALFAAAVEPQPLPNADEELNSFVVADGFEVSLFASDPLISKPTQMNFDPQGRLWVASSATYPQVKPGEEPDDKILILEDTKGVGRADKVTVFADHLFIPTGVAPGDGGAYVANSTQVIHFKDTDGDGKADLKRVILDGFGTEDTHHILHTFRWGMDGRLFFNQSIYIHSHVETPYGVKRLNGGGTWRYNPHTLELEVFTKGLVNHWGHCFTRWGESLGTDGAGGEGVNFFFHGATFCTSPGAARILHGTTPGSPKYASAEIISGRHFPDDWQGDLITNDFRASRMVRFKLTEEGSGFTAKLMPDVITFKTTGRAGSVNGVERVFRPIDVKVGPDGALYIADWFNPIINHGEIDFRDPRRDHTHGRIWRLTAKGRPLVERPKLVGATVADLLEKFKAPEDYTRAQARRVLIERGAAEVLPALQTWIAGLDTKDAQFEHNRLEGLWLYQAFDTPQVDLLRAVLASPEAHAREAATRVLRDWHAKLPDAFDVLAKLVQDESPRVRLEAITALENISDQRSLEIALRALDKPKDANIDFALFHACNGLKDYWLPGVEQGTYTFGGNFHALSYALQSVGARSGVAPLLKLLNEGKITAENTENVLALIGGLGGPEELTALYRMQSATQDPALRGKILSALLRAAQDRNARPTGDLAGIKPLIASPDNTVSAAALRLAGAWKIEALRGDAEGVLNNPQAADARKLAALDALTALGGPKSIAVLKSTATAPTGDAVRARAIVGLAALDHKTAVADTVTLLAQPVKESAVSEIFAALCKNEGAGKELAQALAAVKIAPINAEAGLRYFNASGQNEPELSAFFKSAIQPAAAAGGVASPALPGKKPAELAAAMNADEKKILAPEDMKALLADVQQHGDPFRGEAIFRRATLSCFSCHALGGAGGQVGPDLSNVGAASPLDYIVDSVLSPNKTVKEGYNSFAVLTKNKQMFTGVFVRETPTHLILRDGVTDEIPIALNSIAKKREAGSLMPNGLADGLTRGEFADLIRFLSELGKPGNYSMAQSLSVRRYALKLQDAWVPLYAQVSGELPVSSFASLAENGVAELKFELDVTTPGALKLTVNSPAGLTLKQGAATVDLAKGSVTVEAGKRAFELTVNLAQRVGAGIKIDVDEVPGGAHFKRVGGK